MKHTLLLMLVLSSVLLVQADGFDRSDLGPRNIIKTNLIADGLLIINANYEYKLTERFSLGLLTGYALPKERTLEAIAGTKDGGKYDYAGKITPTGIFFNPYFRNYFNGAMTGFYAEVFTRFSSYKAQIPYDYTKNGVPIHANADASVSGYGGGLAIGTQVGLGPMFVMDFLFGAGLCGFKAHAETNDPNLDTDDYADIKQTMDDIESVNIIFLDKAFNNLTFDASDSKAWADLETSLFPILRASISFGIMF